MQHTDCELLIAIFFNIIIVHHCQVLGRTSPFPLILLPQFGGYWIEGTNHEPKDPPEADQPPCPTSHIKLETNSTAKIYRKNFMGKVRMKQKGSGLCITKQQKVSILIYSIATQNIDLDLGNVTCCHYLKSTCLILVICCRFASENKKNCICKNLH